MKDTHLLVIGAGNVGTHTLDLLARRPDAPRITLAGRDEELLIRQVNLSRMVAAQLGHTPRLDHVVMDVDHIDRTAATLAELSPDIVFSTVSLQAWWVINELPKDLLTRLDEAEIGPWLPMQLTLIHKVMQAVKASGIDTQVVNAALPDATHTILDKVGLAPTIGIGNVANIVPALRHAAADQLGKRPDQVDLRVVMEAFVSHRVPRTGDAGDAPYRISVLENGSDVTERVNVGSLLQAVATRYRRLGGVRGAVLTAASAVTVIEALTSTEPRLVHAPGPNALIGGYPVAVSAKGLDIQLPDGLSLTHALDINKKALWHDGIAEIRDDGSVRYSDPHMDIVKSMIGYDVREMKLADSEACARELAAKYGEFKKSLGS
ncbi:saccharopine dehydrogenase NADP-binding domain-containing protein [Streptomyces sp. NPDC001601]|uniref:saccharopine dehydrogenase NADP-binding domain-containing protein n=1 Tax=Streptomyces sp. NPDC001601 TaxID=3364592 RepID=UPI0036A839D1